MNLTFEKLKKLINETMLETRVRPMPPAELSNDHLEKIHTMIASGDPNLIKQAQSLIDAFDGDPNYVKNYMEYEQVGNLEKMGTKAASQTGLEFEDTMTSAFDIANQKADEMHPDLKSRRYQSWDDMMRMTDTVNAHTDRFFSAHDAEVLAQKRKSAIKEAKLDPTYGSTLSGKLSFKRRVMRDPKVHQSIKDLMSSGNPGEVEQSKEFLRALYPEYAAELESYESPQSSWDYKHDFTHFYHDAKKRAKEEPPGLSESLMFEGDGSILEHFRGATLEEGGMVCEACLFEQLQEASCGCPDLMGEAEYQGRKVTLNKPMRGDVKKFKVYVKDPKTGNVKKVNFGDPNMKIKKSNPKRRKSFRARHNCDNPGPKTKARYWSCKKW